RDVHNSPGRRIVARRELHVGSEVDARQRLEQFWPATFRDPGCAIHDEVLLEPRPLHLNSLDGERDALVPLEAPDLLARTEVAEDDLVAVDTDPDDRHLWRTVGVQGDQMPQPP